MVRNLNKKTALPLIVAACLVLGGVVLPLFADLSILGLFTKILIFGLLAMSLDLLVGYTGLWCFCQATFFGAAAYTIGIFITHLNMTNFWINAFAGILIAVLIAAIFGYISLRVRELTFLLVTLALGEAGFQAVRRSDFLGSSDGIGGIMYPGFCSSPEAFFYFVLFVCVVCFILLFFLVRSPFGYVLQGIRENEIRMKSLGYNVGLHKYVAFLISGLFAGIAGVLYVYFNGLISPTSMGLEATGLLWLMLILGGAGTLWGCLTGSAIIYFLQYFVSSLAPLRWPMIVGVIFVLAVMFARRGIYVLVKERLITAMKGVVL
jgi:branched-chain amino acid transport system permease protein